MTEYELVWTVDIRRVLPIGVSIVGSSYASGSGSAPKEAMDSLKRSLNDRFSDLANQAFVLPSDSEPF